MTIENEYTLSFYTEITSLDKKNKVMLVKHVETGELFVKKIIAAYCAPVYCQLKEADIAGVPRVIESIEDDGQLYVIEEYIHGKSLSQILNEKGTLPETDVRSISLSLCNILISLHDLNPPIIHRDIKPSNLMLTSDGMLRLIDFDAAKNAADNQMKDTHLLGTGGFAAPEQYGFGSSDARTDIYGVGSTINFLLTGKLPNEEFCKGCFEKIVRKCLAVDSVDRFQSASQLYDSIENFRSAFDIDQILLGDLTGLKAPRKFFPVGFRSLNPLRMISSAILHFLSFYIMMDIGKLSAYDNTISFLIVVFTAAWFGNYLGIRNFLKRFSRHIVIRIAFTIILWAIVALLYILILPDYS